MATIVNTVGGSDGGASEQQRTQKIESLRKVLYGIGAFQVFWGVVGMLCAFSWMSNLLTICVGAICCQNFSTLNNTMSIWNPTKVRGCCCDVVHIRGLCIAIIVFACLEIFSFGITGALLATVLLAYAQAAEAINNDPDFNNAYGWETLPVAEIRYIGIALILGAVWPVVSLALAAAVMCEFDAIESNGRARTLATSSTVTVVYAPQAMQQGQQMQQQQMPQVMIAPGGQMQYGAQSYPAPNPYALQQQQQQQQPAPYPQTPGDPVRI
jgi:MFS family permease